MATFYTLLGLVPGGITAQQEQNLLSLFSTDEVIEDPYPFDCDRWKKPIEGTDPGIIGKGWYVGFEDSGFRLGILGPERDVLVFDVTGNFKGLLDELEFRQLPLLDLLRVITKKVGATRVALFKELDTLPAAAAVRTGDFGDKLPYILATWGDSVWHEAVAGQYDGESVVSAGTPFAFKNFYWQDTLMTVPSDDY